MSLFFYDPDLLSSYDSAYVPHQALITSSSRKLSRDIGMPRNTREDVSLPGNVFDCQHARRDPDDWLQVISMVTVWRRSNRNNISTIEEAFADCALPTPPGPAPLWGPGSIPNNWADFL